MTIDHVEQSKGPEARFTGPLAGLRVIEIGSIGPGPFCAMLLADLGADVIRVDRVSDPTLSGPNADFTKEVLHRGRRSIAVDLKHPDGADVVLSLADSADIVIEGFRPGVAERLGIGPDECLTRNPRLIYGRMTGFGQDGPLSQQAGHDINYLAVNGTLSMIGRRDQPPTPPLSLVGDFGGGGMLLAMGVLAAVYERERSGHGQVIDAAMVDGAALLAAPFFGYLQTGAWRSERGTNVVDSGAPYYDVYQTADDKWVALGAIEPHFYRELLQVLGIGQGLPEQNDRTRWPELRAAFASAIRGRTRDQWTAAAAGRECCLSPVIEPSEAAEHPHHRARQMFVTLDGLTQPAPAPRFSRTPPAIDRRPPIPGEHSRTALTEWGIDADQVAAWRAGGALGPTSVSA